MKNNKKKKRKTTNMAVYIDKLKYLANIAREKIVPEEEAINNNLTETFYETIEGKTENGELINITFRGEVRTGKSLAGISVMEHINQHLKKIGLLLKASQERSIKGKDKPVESYNPYYHIFSDQIEFLRFITSGEENVCIIIDEWSKLGGTGINASTEEALYETYSDIFAGKYIHRINCSPRTIGDPNSNIILEVMGKDTEKKITRCKLVYRFVGEAEMITLGYVDINVAETIEAEFYQSYKEKKFKRMELLDKHGVRDIRELEFAEIVIETYKKLQSYANVEKVKNELIMAMVGDVRRQKSRIYSIVAENEIMTRTKGLLDMKTTISHMNKKLKSKSIEKIPLDEKEEIEAARKLAEELLTNRLIEEGKLAELYGKYTSIGEKIS